jgi:hypothetical protein
VDRWCTARGELRGAIVDLETIWKLSRPWYVDRLDHDWRPKTPQRIRELFENAGLSGDFWDVS